MIDWQNAAAATIQEVDQAIPPDADLQARKRALNAARPYEFAVTSWGRKVWARHARKYLEKHGLPPLHQKPNLPLVSPLDRQRERGRQLLGQN